MLWDIQNAAIVMPTGNIWLHGRSPKRANCVPKDGRRDDRTPVRSHGGGPRGAARIAREHVQPRGGDSDTVGRDRGTEGADGTRQPHDQGDAQLADGRGRHTVGAWLGDLCRSIDGKGRLERIIRNEDGRLTATIAYTDGSHDEVTKPAQEVNTDRDLPGPDGP